MIIRITKLSNLLAFLILLLSQTSSSFAQKGNYIYQSVIVDEKLEGIGGVFIKNLNSNKFAISDSSGAFSISCKVTDSLLVSAMGYELKKVNVSEEGQAYIKMSRIVHVLKDVNVYDFKNWHTFEKEFLELDLPKQEVNVTGLPKGRPSETPVHLRSNEFSRKPPVIAQVLSPFSTLGYYLNDDEKSKRKVLKMMKIEENERVYWSVMHVDSIKVWVQVPDSLMNDFILYCNLKLVDKSNTKTYYYKEKVMELYPLFIEENK